MSNPHRIYRDASLPEDDNLVIDFIRTSGPSTMTLEEAADLAAGGIGARIYVYKNVENDGIMMTTFDIELVGAGPTASSRILSFL